MKFQITSAPTSMPATEQVDVVTLSYNEVCELVETTALSHLGIGYAPNDESTSVNVSLSADGSMDVIVRRIIPDRN